MFSCQHLKSSLLIVLTSLAVAGCEVVELDSAGKPIIPMSAEEAASLANMDPKDVVTKMWTDIVQDAQKAPISLESLENKKENDKSYFVRFSGVVEQVEVKSKFITVSVNTGNEIIPIQVGSMIKGNAIRDASSLLSFDQFKNQIQYSKLAKELNKSAVQNLVKLDDSSVGKKVDVLSALTIKGDNIQNVVPLDIKIVE
ncbi:hypothetical protein CBG46_04495 [Actinobacillus succinogenes]|uniref:Putative lipoprotein n=1 Tax=Actinobacillus succinogenes (strain ATCC 55618 / DSM 22257 / CCUG 43843 / 130Z) TaxID=339671 RepID=A6VKQ7_ACTSZ|nr:DUF2291 family protein [Actinobacillus succinogenes]ABR73554.1 putative lipoprotein [Actinobacillus succinogenes 130Z]PHI39983.1 hypothetical protein CBG46_04495 [Actinobacillus succinogenes]